MTLGHRGAVALGGDRDALGPGEWRSAAWFGRWNHWEMAGYYQGAAALW